MFLACHTHNMYVFFLERDTCVLIVVSQGTRNRFLLEFIKRYYLNEAVATDLRYSLGYLRQWVDEKCLDSKCVRTYTEPGKSQKAAGAVVEFIISSPLRLSVSQFKGLTSVSGWHCFLLRVRNIACCRKRYFLMQSHYFFSSSCLSTSPMYYFTFATKIKRPITDWFLRTLIRMLHCFNPPRQRNLKYVTIRCSCNMDAIICEIEAAVSSLNVWSEFGAMST